MNFTYGEFVTALASDSTHMWIGTDGGLVRFNKKTEKMTFYNKANVLPSNFVYALAIDHNKNLWIGTGQGLVKYDGKNWHTYNTENSDLQHNGISAISVDSSNRLWMGNRWYITIFNNTSWKSIETGHPALSYIFIDDIEFDNNGNAWIAASWGLGRVRDDSLTVITDEFQDLTSIAIDTNETIWIGTDGDGLFKYDGTWTQFDTVNSAIPSNSIFDLKFDNKGNLWGGTYPALFKLTNGEFIVYDSNNSDFPLDASLALEIESDTTIWIGTGIGAWGHGLYKFNGSSWKHYSTGSSGLLNNFPYSVMTDDRGFVWISYMADEMIQKYDGSDWCTYTLEDDDYFNSEFSLVCDDDSTKIWLGHGLLLYFIGKNWAGVYSDRKNTISNYIKSDAAGNIWTTSRSGAIKKYDGQQWTLYTPENTGIAFSVTEQILFDPQGNMYVSTDLGLVKYDGTNWELLPANSLMSNPDRFLTSTFTFDKDGIMWIGTLEEGLIKYDGNQKTIFDETNSDLPDETIQDLDFDSAGNLWIATQDYGLVRFDRSENMEIFNQNKSGKSSDFLIMEMEIDINDNVWFLSEWDGLCVFREGGIIYPSSINHHHQNIPSKYQLLQNYPNPFNPQTTISFIIPQNGYVSVKVYDITGRLIRTLADGYKTAGFHSVVWDSRNANNVDVASGMYIYQVQYQGQVLNKKLLLIR